MENTSNVKHFFFDEVGLDYLIDFIKDETKYLHWR
jgi:hypothetical protein